MTSTPFLPGQRLHLRDEILLAIIDRDIGAESFAELDLFRRARRGENPGAEMFRQLDRGRADAARPAMDQERLAGLQRAAGKDVVIDGEIGFRHARRLDQAERPGLRQAKRGIGERNIRHSRPSRPERRFRRRSAHWSTPSPSADDAAGDFEPGNVAFAGRRRIEPGALDAVGAVDRPPRRPRPEPCPGRAREPAPRAA